MKSILAIEIALSWMGMACVGACGAATLVDYPVQPSLSESDCFGVFFSDLNQNHQTAAVFVLPSGGYIDHVVWYGGYLNSTADPAGPIPFRLRLYADAGDLPLPIPYEEFSRTASGVPTGLLARSGGCTGPWQVYEYAAAIPPTLIPAGTRVWISIVEDTPDRVWFQAPSTASGCCPLPANCRRLFEETPWLANGEQLPALRLAGESVVGATPVSFGRIKSFYAP